MNGNNAKKDEDYRYTSRGAAIAGVVIGCGVEALRCAPNYRLKDGKCETCPAGSSCAGGTDQSVPCKTGEYSPPGASSCEQCTNGPTDCRTLDNCRYTDPSIDSTSNCPWVITCAVGQQWTGTKCEACPIGTYSNTELTMTNVDSANKSCKLCPKPQDAHSVTWVSSNTTGAYQVQSIDNCKYTTISCYHRGKGCRPGQTDFYKDNITTGNCNEVTSLDCKVELYPMETIPKSIYVK